MSLRVLVVMLVLLALVPSTVSAQTAPPVGEDSVVGAGVAGDPSLPVPLGTIQFDARSGPVGENPTGTATGFTRYGTSFGGPVTCLLVVGDRATIGTAEGFFYVHDGGPGGTDTFDEVSPGADPAVCPEPPSGPFRLIVTPSWFGRDVVVHDALTRPQAKAACKAEKAEIGAAAFRAKYAGPHPRPMRNCIEQRMA